MALQSNNPMTRESIAAELTRLEESLHDPSHYSDVLHEEPFRISGLRVYVVRDVLEVKRHWLERLFSFSPLQQTKKVANPAVAGGKIFTIGRNAFCSMKTYISLQAAIARSR